MMRAEDRLLRVSKIILSELTRRGALGARANPSIELALLPNAALRQLKKRYLGKVAKVVDVLAFPAKDFPSPEHPTKYLGEVYINAALARRDFPRARFLLIHGILHLLGYRHERKRDTIVMERLEQELLLFLSHGNAMGGGT